MNDSGQPVEQHQSGPSLWERVASDSYMLLLVFGLIVLLGSLAVLVGAYFAHYGFELPGG